METQKPIKAKVVIRHNKESKLYLAQQGPGGIFKGAYYLRTSEKVFDSKYPMETNGWVPKELQPVELLIVTREKMWPNDIMLTKNHELLKLLAPKEGEYTMTPEDYCNVEQSSHEWPGLITIPDEALLQFVRSGGYKKGEVITIGRTTYEIV